MTARTDSGRAADGFMSDRRRWNSVDWNKTSEIVNRIQARIVKAAKEGDRKRSRGLQRLLIRSRSAKLMAVRRVTSNRGKRTAGVDKVKLNTPAAKWQAARQLNRPDCKPKPLRRICIPKKNGKKRPLGIPTMHDRCEQALELLALDPMAECSADKCSNGFRKKRGAHDAIEGCHNALRLKGSPKWILEADIRGCFDNIRHEWMLENIPVTSRRKLEQWLKSGHVENGMFSPTTAGTPQGGIISPTLANMVLDGLEDIMRKYKRSHKAHMVRYADDFIITGESEGFLENVVRPLVSRFLRERGLGLSEEKTRISHIDDGFDFLGFNMRKYKGKLLTKPSKSSIASVTEKIRGIMKCNKTAKTENLIRKLNPVIRGWANYFRHSASSETFGKADNAIWEMTWKWAKRRHPDKPLGWIRKKHYQSEGSRNWVFRERNGKTGLFRMTSVPIRRHVKIKGEANPYDPSWKEYFERREIRGRERKTDKSRQDRLWLRQRGICPACRTNLDNGEQWHTHHRVPRKDGGGNNMDNLALLHETCHMQIHCQNSEGGLLPDALRCLIEA